MDFSSFLFWNIPFGTVHYQFLEYNIKMKFLSYVSQKYGAWSACTVAEANHFRLQHVKG
jgi:hypothetical protein